MINKIKHKGNSYDNLKNGPNIGTSTPECYLNVKEDKRHTHTVNTNEDSPRSKRRVRRSMDHYHHPDFDNYLLHQTHYYHSLNAFPKGSKFQKEIGMRGMLMKKKLNEPLVRSNVSGGMISRYKSQTNSDK